MVKKYLFFLFLGITLFSLVSATTINVKTIPDHEVQVSISKAGTAVYEAIVPSVKTQSDEYGKASFNFSFTEEKYNLAIFIKKDGEKVNEKRLNDLITGEDQDINLVPEGLQGLIPIREKNLSVVVENVSDENISAEDASIESVENETVLVDKNDTGISIKSIGLSVLDKGKGFFSGKVFYYVLGIVVVGLFVLVAKRKFNMPRGIKITKLSELGSDDRSSRRDDIEDAERRLKEAQDEVNKLKNGNKIKKLEEELDRLRKGED
ncbi:MAG: hypothetical protein Q8P15_03665 [Nanoarchaeota archaeon]|nr:hypothetical protein [Nanoarchaeota archaeon]